MGDTPKRGLVLNNTEKGAFLMALGRQMFLHNLSAGAALDGNSKPAMVNHLLCEGLDGAKIDEILDLNFDEISEAIDGSI